MYAEYTQLQLTFFAFHSCIYHSRYISIFIRIYLYFFLLNNLYLLIEFYHPSFNIWWFTYLFTSSCILIKGTVSVILNNPRHAKMEICPIYKLQRYPECILNIHVFCFFKLLIFICGFSASDLRISCFYKKHDQVGYIYSFC